MEVNLRRALNLSNGDWLTLWHSALSIVLWAVAIAGLVLPLIFLRRPAKASGLGGAARIDDRVTGGRRRHGRRRVVSR